MTPRDATRLAIPIWLLLAGAGVAQDAFQGAPASASARDNPYRAPDDVQGGQSLFLAHCAACHGAFGEGSGAVPALRQRAVQRASDGALFWYLTTGSANGEMPAWSAIVESDRWKIVAYVKTLPETPVARSPERPTSSMLSAKLDAPPPTAPFTDFRYEHPGVVRRITVGDLPPPFATAAAANAAHIVSRPADAWPRVPHDFRVGLYANGLATPRVIRVAPNGDIFVAETGAGRVRVYRGITADGKPRRSSVFAGHLQRPYGIAFYPPGPDPKWIYIADTEAVRRYPYRNRDTRAGGPAARIVELGPDAGHWTRDIAFSADGRTLFVAVGSGSNADDPDTSPAENNRANILAFDPDGAHARIYASGIRNPSGLAVDPDSGRLWCTVNERDGLGDDLVPDYVTAVREGGFYGWPWWYMGGHQDPRHAGKHPELQNQTITPDVLIQPHSASLQIAFYTGSRFPAAYRGDLFATEHGSWNRSLRAGYEVIRIPRHQTDHASGEYQDFMTGFVLPGGQVWGRPVGIAVAADGSLLVSDDASGSIWRVDYVGQPGS
ncbi:MAG: PQQ-dependent sugar dehydrogenase [Steroidobacterales bacterium]